MDFRPASGTVAELKTSSPSPFSYGNNLRNPIFNFLGPLYNQVVPRPFESTNHEIYDVEEAFRGKKVEFSTVITGLITTYNNNFLTTDILPWKWSPKPMFEWNVFHFNAPLAGRVPNRSIPRLVSCQKSSNGASMLRRGIAFEMENDYLTTEEGIEHLKYNIQSIAQSVQETQNYDVIRALLTCKTYNEMWLDWTGAKSSFSFTELMSYEVANFASLCHDEYSFDNLFARVSATMMAKGFKPDAILVPAGFKQYLSRGDKTSEYIKHSQTGDVGLRQHKQGDSAFDTYEGCTVYEVKPALGAPDTTEVLQNLHNRYTIGERYMMSLSDLCYKNAKNYDRCMRSIYIDNLTSNKYEKISFEKAFVETGVFDQYNGSYSKNVRSLLEEYKKEPSSDKYSIEDPSELSRYDKERRQQAFMFITKDSDGKWTLPSHFGKMGFHAIGFDDFEFMAATVLTKLDDCVLDCTPSRQWDDMIDLIKCIENEQYNGQFWRLVIQENWRYGLEDTPSDVILATDMKIPEWKPNAFGSLNLPEELDNVPKAFYPSGWANGPGLQYLASLLHVERWKTIAEKAKKAVTLLNSIVEILKRIFPTCELINPANRSPWFHQPDPITAFFCNVIANRDPIFLPRQEDVEAKGIAKANLPEEMSEDTMKSIFENVRDEDWGRVRGVLDGVECTPILNPILILLANIGQNAAANLATFYLSEDVDKNALRIFATYFCNEASNIAPQFQKLLWEAATNFMHLTDTPEVFQTLISDFNAKSIEEKNAYLKTLTAIQDRPHIQLSTILKNFFDFKAPLAEGGKKEEKGRLCWRRTPLTMSSTLLKQILLNRSAAEVAIILPSDYTTMHLSPLQIPDSGMLPSSVTDRPAYFPLDMRSGPFKELRHLHLVNKFSRIISTERIPLSRMRQTRSVQERGRLPAFRPSSFLAVEEERTEDFLCEEDVPTEFEIRREEDLAKLQPLSSVRLRDHLPSTKDRDELCIEYGRMYAEYDSPILKRRWLDGFRISNPVQRAFYWAILFSQSDNSRHWLNLDANHVHVPINIMLFKPHIEFLMATIIIMKKGESTGASVYTIPDFQVARDGNVKKVLGNYTFWSTAIVQQPKHVSINEALYPIRYLGGCNNEFIRNASDLHNGKGIHRPSIIAAVVPVTETNHPRFLSLTGYYADHLYNPDIDSDNVLQWSSAPFYDRIYNFSALAMGVRGMANYETRVVKPNYIVLQGSQFVYSHADKSYSIRIPSQGHRREKGSDPDACFTWNGLQKMFPGYNWVGKVLQ